MESDENAFLFDRDYQNDELNWKKGGLVTLDGRNRYEWDETPGRNEVAPITIPDIFPFPKILVHLTDESIESGEADVFGPHQDGIPRKDSLPKNNH